MQQDCVLVYCTRLWSDEFILILKDRPEWQRGRFNLPGGKIEPGEEPYDAAVRELIEETGYQPDSTLKLMGRMLAGTQTIYCFRCQVNNQIVPKPRQGETESALWTNWFAVNDDPRLLPSLKVIVPLMRCCVEGFTIDVMQGKLPPAGYFVSFDKEG